MSTRLARTDRLARRLLPWLLLVASSRPGWAMQQTDSLTLGAALATTLARGVDIEIARRRLDRAFGQSLATNAPFDWRLQAFVLDQRDHTQVTENAGLLPAISSRTEYGLALQRTLPLGVLMNAAVGVARTGLDLAQTAPTGAANVSMDLRAPLWRDRGGAVTSAGPRAASLVLDAAHLDVRQATAASALNGVVAYWNYAAAERALVVAGQAESTAAQLIEETRQLVAVDERPASDLSQMVASLASKRAQRARVAQEVDQSRREVGLALGLDAMEIKRLSHAASPLPDLANVGDGLDSSEVARMVAKALAGREDLVAAELEGRSVALLADAANNDLRPRLDLVVRLGYSGFEQGPGLVSPLFRNVRGFNTSIQLQSDMPLGNYGARGRLLQQEAALAEARIARADLYRRIASGVNVAASALGHTRVAVQAARAAVVAAEEGVANERLKFQLGLATVFEVIFAADALTNAQLARIDAELAAAVALARFRYETGTLVDWSHGEPTVATRSLTTWP